MYNKSQYSRFEHVKCPACGSERIASGEQYWQGSSASLHDCYETLMEEQRCADCHHEFSTAIESNQVDCPDDIDDGYDEENYDPDDVRSRGGHY